MKQSKIAFVCTGNTCRSPMAEGLFNMLAEKRGLPVRAISCGAGAGEGFPASEEAVIAAGEYGADISAHRSLPATAELLSDCDKIYCMTATHLRYLQGSFPELSGKSKKLSDRDISDPFGGSQREYQLAADEIYKAVLRIAEELTED